MNKSEIILQLSAKKEHVNHHDLFNKIINNKDINLENYDVEEISSGLDFFKDEFVDYITNFGLSNFLVEDEGSDLEHLIKKGASRNQITSVFKRYLRNIGVDNELIIVDPYFFAATSSSYPSLVLNILSPYLNFLDRIYFITRKDKDIRSVKTSIGNILKSQNIALDIRYKSTNNWHDRFWMSNNRREGLISGNSLNGFGRKYSLVDRLERNDVREIINSLKNENLL